METTLLIRLVIVGLASWRVASLLVQEVGPFSIFWRIRKALGLEDPGPQPEGLRGELYALWSCAWCMSIWTTPAVWYLWELSPQAVGVVAAMSIAVLVNRWSLG